MTHNALIRLDWSPFSTLVICRCGWRAARWTRHDAWTVAAGHCMGVHEDPDASADCRDAAYRNRRRANR